MASLGFSGIFRLQLCLTLFYVASEVLKICISSTYLPSQLFNVLVT